MRRTFLLAFRNLSRSSRRSAALFALVLIAFLSLTLLRSSYADLFSKVRSSGRQAMGNMNFTKQKGGGLSFDDYKSLKRRLLADPRYTELKAVANVEGLVGTEERSAPASGVAMEAAFDNPNEAELGVDLAASLGLKPGDEFSAFLGERGFAFRLKELVRTEASARDRFYLRVDLEALARRLNNITIQNILVYIAVPPSETRSLIEETRALPELASYSCSAYALGNTDANAVVGVYEDNFRVVLVVVALAMVLALSNAGLLSVWERGQEWGTLLTLGDTRPALVALIAVENLLLALAACLAGAALTLAVAAVVNAMGGIVLPPPPTASEPLHLGLKPEAASLGLASIVSLCCALAAALVSASGLKRKAIVELLFERN